MAVRAPAVIRQKLKLYRGRNHHEWQRVLQQAGWPQKVANAFALWITGMGPLPQFDDCVEDTIPRRIVPGD